MNIEMVKLILQYCKNNNEIKDYQNLSALDYAIKLNDHIAISLLKN